MITLLHVSRVACHVSRVTCHMSNVTCHMSQVTYQMSHFYFFGKSCGASQWRVCYQHNLPHLVAPLLKYFNEPSGISNLKENVYHKIFCTLFVMFLTIFVFRPHPVSEPKYNNPPFVNFSIKVLFSSVILLNHNWFFKMNNNKLK